MPESGPQTLLGLDFGVRRIGVALGNTLTRQARPLTVIDCAVALGQADAPIPPVKALVVEQDGFLYALSVEEVEDVVWIEEEAHPLPAGRHGGWEQAALGMVGVGGEMLLLADPAGVLDAANSALAPAPALAPADRAD